MFVKRGAALGHMAFARVRERYFALPCALLIVTVRAPVDKVLDWSFVDLNGPCLAARSRTPTVNASDPEIID